MKNMIAEFKEFINKGDVVTIAVGLVLALYFKTIVDKIIEGVITPILAAIFGESNYAGIGFDLGDSFVSIGLVIGAAIDFVVVAFILFLIIKAYNSWRGAIADRPRPGGARPVLRAPGSPVGFNRGRDGSGGRTTNQVVACTRTSRARAHRSGGVCRR